MNELFEETGQSILCFKRGEIIIRTKSAAVKEINYNQNLGITTEYVKSYDNSFRTDPMEFLCVKNNVIFLRGLKDDFEGKKTVVKLILEKYFDDWAVFEVPDGLTIEECI